MFFRLYRSFFRSFLFIGIAIVFSLVIFALLGVLRSGVEKGIDQEYRPIFGSEIRFDIPSGSTGAEALIDSFRDKGYLVARVRSLNTTLLGEDGKTYGAQLVAYDGDFPQYARLETRSLKNAYTGAQKVQVSPGILPLLMSGSLSLDDKFFPVTHEILETTIGGFAGFGGDSGKIILPYALLSGSSLFGEASRMDDKVLISPRAAGIFDSEVVSMSIRSAGFRAEIIDARSDRLLERIDEIFSVITAVFVAILLASSIIVHSLLARMRDRLARPYRQFFLLGVRSSRMVYGECVLHVVVFSTSVIFSIALLFLLFLGISRVTLPIDIEWGSILESALRSSAIVAIIYSSILLFLTTTNHSRSLKGLVLSYAVIFLLLASALWILFPTVFAGGAFACVAIVIALLCWLIRLMYRYLSSIVMRSHLSFGVRDGVRTLSRKGFPSVFLTLSFFLATLLIVSVGGLSASFYTALRSSSDADVDLFALNIVSRDYESLKQSGLITEENSYSIIRGRISKINQKPLTEHLGKSETGEFRREFNITPKPAPDLLLTGRIRSGAYVGVDREFAQRLGVGLGDRIEFLISGRTFSLEVSALYESVRSGVTPFFYFRVDPQFFAEAPKSYFATFRTENIEQTKSQIISKGSSAITFVDIGGIARQVESITTGVLWVLGLTTLLFILALFGAFYTLFSDYRSREAHRFRQYQLLGARRSLLDQIRLTTRILPIALSLCMGTLFGVALLWGLFARLSILEWDVCATLVIIGGIISLFLFYVFFLACSTQIRPTRPTHNFPQ